MQVVNDFYIPNMNLERFKQSLIAKVESGFMSAEDAYDELEEFESKMEA